VRLVLVLAALALAGCESNYARNERAAREGRRLVAAGGKVKAGARNPDVHVRRSVIVRGPGGGLAAVVELRNEGREAQAAVPLLIDVRDAKGASVYRNDLKGLQPALQQAALVPPRRSVWWVNDQLLGVTSAGEVSAQVGRGKLVRRVPRVALRGVELSDGTLSGTVDNRSGTLQRNVAIFAVASRGDRIVAAGRALVAKAAPPPAKPARFSLLFVGDPAGARIQMTVAPSPS
jgi:hypothetical protein